MIVGELTGRESMAVKGDRTDVEPIKVLKAEVGFMLNALKRGLHPRYLLNNELNNYPLISVFLWPLELDAGSDINEVVRPVSKNDLKEDRRHR